MRNATFAHRLVSLVGAAAAAALWLRANVCMYVICRRTRKFFSGLIHSSTGVIPSLNLLYIIYICVCVCVCVSIDGMVCCSASNV